ncbi:hypothetical protein [Streptomyces sp. NPDC003710]
MHQLPTTPGMYVIAGLALWLFGGLAWAASGITHLVEAIRKCRTPEQPS